MAPLTASVVVATRNRLSALEMSLPLLLKQTRLPQEIVVVDSSDDHAPVAALVARLAAGSPVPLRLIHSAPGGALQRNLGRQAISGDVVIFPDDDSLFFPEAIAAVMRIYELDRDGVVAGVAAGATARSPLEDPSAGVAATYAAKRQRLPARLLAGAFLYAERHLIRSPFNLLREEIVRRKTLPPAIAAAGGQLAADQEGFRMSFRTAMLGPAPFNEALTLYALGEDKDLCYGLPERTIIVELTGDHVRHHEFPGARQGGFRRGFTEVLNQAYIVCRHTLPGDRARRGFWPYFLLLGVQILLRSASRYQRARLAGYLRAMWLLRRLDRAPASDLDARYRQIIARHLAPPGA